MPFSLLKFGLNKDYPFEQSPDLPQPSALNPLMMWSSLGVADTVLQRRITSLNIMGLPM